jgi:PAS domain S-box-containing protein
MIIAGLSIETIISRHAALFDTARDAVIGTTVPGEIVYWNRGAEKIYGWEADEVRGRSIVDVTPTDVSRDEAESIMNRLRLGHSWTGSFLVRNRAGEEFRVLVCDLPVRSPGGELIGFVGISTRSPADV